MVQPDEQTGPARRAAKSPEAFRTISEVAADLDVPQHVLRFWESKFSQLRPLKRGGGRRYYRPEDVTLLRGIRTLLYTQGYTIKGVQRLLKENGTRYVLDAGRGNGAHAAPEALQEEVHPEEAVAPAPAAVPAAEPPEPTREVPAVAEEPSASLSAEQRRRLGGVLEQLRHIRSVLRESR